jgi:hypothetical protein
MNIPFSKKLQELIKKLGAQQQVYDEMRKLNLFETWISYIIDSKFARGVELQQWCISQADNINLLKIVNDEGWLDIEDEDKRVLTILKYWQNGKNLKYVGDKENYGTNEYWATISQILEKRSDDCDGFANIIYHSCKLAGITDNRLYIVAGNVDSGGHCYIVYVGNDGVEYPIDGCYWTSISLMMLIPYTDRTEYFYGQKEWFRFNTEGCYKRIT